VDLDTPWEFITDEVMGGVSQGSLLATKIDGLAAMRLKGLVSLENNGGFIQMAFNINKNGTIFDASCFSAIELDVLGNDENYDLRLRTARLSRPWQSYRANFFARARHETVHIPFSNFCPHKTERPFEPNLLLRIGVLAIGRSFEADISLSAVRLVR
tara:strand:+ start:385 stop:855 length:471 start_codon:yes stop_codon:yes gene_type:complete